MKYESTHGLRLPKVGFGTWNIGGGGSADRRRDKKSLAALLSALELGYTHFDTAEMYAAGHAEELLGQALRVSGRDREGLFITTKVSPEHLDYRGVLAACDTSLRRLGLEYVDLYLIHWPISHMDLEEGFRGLNKLVRDGKVRHLGVSNFGQGLLEKSRALAHSQIVTNQVPLSLLDRTYIRNGMLAYCKTQNIVLTAYSPFEAGKLTASRALGRIAAAHSATPHQIALAWLCGLPGVITIPMSFDPGHQRENIEAASISLTPKETEQLG